jgi:glycosyltransferase involved in cell wall biosynthesis
MGARLLFFVSEDWYFCSHRLPVALAARAAGYEVGVVTRVREHGAVIREHGLRLFPVELARGGLNPLRDLGALGRLVRVCREFRPDILHAVAVKPVVYGAIAAALAGVPHTVNALGGLGYVFTSRRALARLLRPFALLAYRVALGRRSAWLILQNPDDLAALEARGIASRERTTLIRGSGVDLCGYRVVPEPEGVPLVVLPARLLWDKGIAEFVDAAERLRRDGVVAKFALAGDIDPENPASVPRDWIEAKVRSGAVEWWGWQERMSEVFGRASVVCLPSYREGLPKALIEAAACGRAIVTTDVPGCREVVADGENGLLVPARDAVALARALGRLIRDRPLRTRFGAAGRVRAEREFAVDRVVDATLAVYRELVAR